jgi:formylmethanofuran dehydrogenase subunit B
VDFTLGAPRYRADEPASEVVGEVQAVLIAGEAGALPPAFEGRLAGRAVAVIGPRASEAPFAEVAIDTGVAGIHDGGTAYRLDEVPLPLTPALAHPRSAAAVLGAIAGALASRQVAAR